MIDEYDAQAHKDSIGYQLACSFMAERQEIDSDANYTTSIVWSKDELKQIGVQVKSLAHSERLWFINAIMTRMNDDIRTPAEEWMARFESGDPEVVSSIRTEGYQMIADDILRYRSLKEHFLKISQTHSVIMAEPLKLRACMWFFAFNYPEAKAVYSSLRALAGVLNSFDQFGDVPNYSFIELMKLLHGMSVTKSLTLAESIHRSMAPDSRGSYPYPAEILYARDGSLGLADKFREWSSTEWDQLERWIKRTQRNFHDLLEVEWKRSSSESLVDPVVPLLQWAGSQTDLVYVMDCLKEAGLMNATARAITEHFDYGGEAKNKAKTYNDTRTKMQAGGGHPSKDKIMKLIEALKERLD